MNQYDTSTVHPPSCSTRHHVSRSVFLGPSHHGGYHLEMGGLPLLSRADHHLACDGAVEAWALVGMLMRKVRRPRYRYGTALGGGAVSWLYLVGDRPAVEEMGMYGVDWSNLVGDSPSVEVIYHPLMVSFPPG
jgi:hypothetical protein